jgi:hypothetical protein
MTRTTAWALEVAAPAIDRLQIDITGSGVLDAAGYPPLPAAGGRLGYVIGAIRSDGSNSPPQWMIDLCAYLEDEQGYQAGISRIDGNWED